MSLALPHLRRALIIGVLVSGTGCRAATMAFGTDAGAARTNAESLMSALEQRFTRVARAPKFLNARMRIGRYAFSPSKLVNDTALWTGLRSTQNGAERDLEVAGSTINGHYTFTPRDRVAVPARAGDSRHFIGLVQLDGHDDWQWTTSVENAVGTMPPDRAGDVMQALFLSAERPAAAVRADYRSAFPRTAMALGRMFTIDSVMTAAQQDGSTLVTLHILTTDAQLKRDFPGFAKYVQKYLEPARYRLRLTDRAGGEWFDVRARESRLVLRFRSHDGALQPLAGPARRMPDTLALHVDGSAKLSFFRVGASNLVGEFIQVNTWRERAWAMRFTKEPEWDLPPLAEQLLHSPLRRPFEGTGVLFRIGFARDLDGQTILGRTVSLAVRESAIMRFLGNLGFTAMSDFAGTVEEEENRFLAEAFAALRADIKSLN